MDQRFSALERAFQLARSGRVADVAQIRQQLKREGYSAAQVEGPALVRQLRALIDAASGNGASPGSEKA